MFYRRLLAPFFSQCFSGRRRHVTACGTGRVILLIINGWSTGSRSPRVSSHCFTSGVKFPQGEGCMMIHCKKNCLLYKVATCLHHSVNGSVSSFWWFLLALSPSPFSVLNECFLAFFRLSCTEFFFLVLFSFSLHREPFSFASIFLGISLFLRPFLGQVLFVIGCYTALFSTPEQIHSTSHNDKNNNVHLSCTHQHPECSPGTCI